jgi:hypothetical protein
MSELKPHVLMQNVVAAVQQLDAIYTRLEEKDSAELQLLKKIYMEIARQNARLLVKSEATTRVQNAAKKLAGSGLYVSPG